jgi:hypothetical protein
MARAFLIGFVLLFGMALYALSPFRAAWVLREAIKTADTATIERKVEWDSVRKSFRASIAGNANLLPEATHLGETVRPTIWQRVKSAFGSTMLDRFVESYITPEGLPQLMRYRRMWNGTVKGSTDEEDKLEFTERVKLFYRRILRAEFQSPTRIEIEMADRHQPGRRYISTMELYGFEWKLTTLRVVGGPVKTGIDTKRRLVSIP